MSNEPQDNKTPDDDAGLYVISVAAELSGLHPQTLRQYDRLGLVSPNRTVGRNRRYSLRDIASLRMVGRLVGEGINHAGIKRIIELESAMANMAIEVAQLRIEVDALLKENPPKALVSRRKNEVIVYKEDQTGLKALILPFHLPRTFSAGVNKTPSSTVE